MPGGIGVHQRGQGTGKDGGSVICGFCGATTDVTFIGTAPRCREWRRCWDAYIERCDQEDAAKRAALTAATGAPGAEVGG
jgi:hypothetical protein